MIPSVWLSEAVQRVQPYIARTPLTYDAEHQIYIKWENRQITGSFKIRGAVNKLLSLQPWELQRGLVTASAGNHGQGVAYAARQMGASVIVFASDHAVPAKLDAIRALGAEVRLVAGTYTQAERAAIQFALEYRRTWVSPYNDVQVIAGQATLMEEIMQQLQSELDTSISQMGAVIVPAGGGGLVVGCGMALERAAVKRGSPHLVAVQSQASPFLYELYVRGTQAAARELDSLADGLAGAVEEGAITIAAAQRYVDTFVLVSENEIARGVAVAQARYGERIEGSAAAALSAALDGCVPARPAVVVITGGNIQPQIHQHLCSSYSFPTELDGKV